jgi:threonine dehydrogenase-like Zn-dependent dehydrogenase
MKSRQAVLVEPGRFEIEEVEIAPGPGQILVRVAVCGLCNWEMNHWHGQIGTCPQTIGHEAAGTVAELGAGVTDVQIGDRITGFGGPGHAEYALYSAGNYFRLAEGVPLEGALGEPLACVCNVLHATEPQVGDYGALVGCGPMGLWCLQALAGRTLAGLIAIDVADWKLDLAREFGASHTLNPKTEDAGERLREITGGHLADFVIEGTGVPAVMAQAVSYLRGRRGRLTQMSAHEGPGPAFDWRPIQNQAVQIRGAHPGWSTDNQDDLRRAVTLLNLGVFHSEKIITHRFPLDRIQEAFETVESKPPDFLKGVVVP